MRIGFTSVPSVLVPFFLLACGPEIVTTEKTVVVTQFVCGDEARTQVSDPRTCPEQAPVVETVTKYECVNGQVVDQAEQCPAWTLSCPEGTTPYANHERHDNGCAYDATCHEDYAYDPATSMCVRVACPPGQTIAPDGYTCTMPEVRHNSCTADADCSAGERCNEANRCVVPCHRDADCNDPTLWCGAPLIMNDHVFETCQPKPLSLVAPEIHRTPDSPLTGSVVPTHNMTTLRYAVVNVSDVELCLTTTRVEVVMFGSFLTCPLIRTDALINLANHQQAFENVACGASSTLDVEFSGAGSNCVAPRSSALFQVQLDTSGAATGNVLRTDVKEICYRSSATGQTGCLTSSATSIVLEGNNLYF